MRSETTCYQFDSVEVQPGTFAVLRDGRALPLEPKAVRTLLYLIENRDRTVTKEDLIEAVWDGAAVTDNALTRIVAQLRRELGDDARQARYIQTVPTLGYRFIAELKATVASDAPAPRRSRVMFGSAAALLAAVFLASLWMLTGRGAVAPSAELQPVQLTTSPAVDLGGSFSPDGKSFAYSSNRSGWFEIFVRPLTSGGVGTQVTVDGKQNVEPAWSPDGKTIAYRSVAEHGIWLIPSSGGLPRRLTAFGSSPAWSPDGKQIAFRSLEPYSLAWFDFPGIGESTIWTVSADGSQLRRITTANNPHGQHAMPSWHPDGTRIAFAAIGGPKSIWTVNTASGALESPMEEGAAYYVAPLFAPDGKGIYCTGVAKNGDLGIYYAAGQGEKPLQLYSTRSDAPAAMTLSRDGKRLMYTRLSNVSQLWTTGTTPDRSKPLYEDAVLRARLPTFSPDGKRLVYVVRPVGRTDDVWMMNADGSGAVPVTDNQNVQSPALWNTEGTGILYISSTAAGYSVLEVNLATGTTKTLLENARRTPGAHNFGMPHITPDARELVYVRPSPSNLWKLSLSVGAPSTGATSAGATSAGAPKQLTFDREGASFPALSWGAEWIAYELKRGEDTQIGVMDRNGSHQEILTDDPGLHWGNSWSLDNRRIAYASYRDGVWNLYWIDRVTRERKQITHYTAYGAFVRNPAWRPGTEEVVYEYSHVKGNVYLMRLP